MNPRPLRSEIESRIVECKRAYTQACAAVLANRPNAHMHAQIACRQLEEARAQLAALEVKVTA